MEIKDFAGVEPKYKGIELDFAGSILIMPPLSGIAYAEHDAFEKIGTIEKTIKEKGNFDSGAYKIMLELVTLALQRNYPKINEKFVMENITDGFALIMYIDDLMAQTPYNKKLMEQNSVKNGLAQVAIQAQKK
jgi:hypothetical protein